MLSASSCAPDAKVGQLDPVASNPVQAVATHGSGGPFPDPVGPSFEERSGPQVQEVEEPAVLVRRQLLAHPVRGRQPRAELTDVQAQRPLQVDVGIAHDELLEYGVVHPFVLLDEHPPVRLPADPARPHPAGRVNAQIDDLVEVVRKWHPDHAWTCVVVRPEPAARRRRPRRAWRAPSRGGPHR